MVEMSDYPLHFRSPIFQKTDSPQYDSEFDALSECSEFHKTLIS